eukprot:575138-Pyramimonas_sp.AAC.1
MAKQPSVAKLRSASWTSPECHPKMGLFLLTMFFVRHVSCCRLELDLGPLSLMYWKPASMSSSGMSSNLVPPDLFFVATAF